MFLNHSGRVEIQQEKLYTHDEIMKVFAFCSMGFLFAIFKLIDLEIEIHYIQEFIKFFWIFFIGFLFVFFKITE